MLSRIALPFIILLMFCLTMHGGDTLYVSVTGDDLGTGRIGSPLKTIAKAFSIASPGNIIYLKSGVHRERITITKNGTTGNPITLTGEKGAIMDGGTLLSGWEKVTTYGGNVYRTRYPGTKPYNLTWNNKYILRIRDEFSKFPGMDTMLVYGPKGWDTYDGYPYRSWDGVRAMWGTLDNYLYLGFGDRTIDPNNEEITCAPSATYNGAVITLADCHFIDIRGLTIRNGYYGIYFKTNSSDCVVEGDSITTGQYNIRITSGSSRIKVLRNKLTLGYIHSLNPDDPRHWFIWAAFKRNSDYDRICVRIDDVGADIDIDGNYLFENFDGVENTGSSYGLLVRNNLIVNMADDGLEPCGEETMARWHGNTVIQCNIAYRHKEITGKGPMYIYNNRFYCTAGNAHGSKSGIYFFSGDTTTAFFYHNTIVTNVGFTFGSTNVAAGLPKLWIVNNLFSCPKIFSENTNWTKKPHFDNNYCGGDLSYPASWWGSNNKVNKNGQLWSMDSIPDFLIKGDSPARDIGVDISKMWSMHGTTHLPLAGYPADYFIGTKPDAGAHQYNMLYVRTGENKMDAEPLKVFPNPFWDHINVKIPEENSGPVTIQVINIQGIILFETKATGSVVLDASGFPEGLYLIRVKGRSGVRVHRVVKSEW